MLSGRIRNSCDENISGKKKGWNFGWETSEGNEGKRTRNCGLLGRCFAGEKKGLYQKNTHTKKIIRGDKKMKKKRK